MSFKEDHISYIERLQLSLSKISDLELAKKRLTYTRWKVAENLDKLLFEFETNVKKNDANILWCPDASSAIENLNKNLKSFNKVSFCMHNAVKHFIKATDIKLPAASDDPEVVIIGAKFIMANTGNFYSCFNSFEEYEKAINAKKIIVVAGIDSVIALQSELYMAKQLYAIFETGNLHYQAEILARPGRARGINAEIVLLLTDLGKNKVLELPTHRPLFSLLNFDLPPVCPLQNLRYDPENFQVPDTLTNILQAFINGVQDNKQTIEGNYGLKLLNQYLPYDIDLYEQILDARSLLHVDEKLSVFSKFIDTDKSSVALNSKKFNDKEKFAKYAERNFFGKMSSKE